MANRIKTADAEAALRSLLQERAGAAAGSNTVLSKKEAAALDPFLKRAEEEVRATQGPHARVTVEEAVSKATENARTVWNRFHAPGTLDGRYLSQAEVRNIAKEDPALGELTRLAYLRAGQPPPDPASAVRTFFATFDVSTLTSGGLPDDRRVDVRPGRAERAELPASVLTAFDHYYRAEEADWASVSARTANIDGHDVTVLYMSTDGDDAYLEVFDPAGKGLASAKLSADEILAWDPFHGRARLAAPLAHLDPPRVDEGLSEPAERRAAGQLPVDWQPNATLASGTVVGRGSAFVDIEGAPAMTAEQRELSYAAFEHLWERHLQHVGAPIELGRARAGTLALGSFTRPDDGKTYLVADWRDVDDGSFTLYFERTEAALKLSILQFNN